MADKSWKQGKKMHLDTTGQIETWKQKITKEQHQVKHQTAKNILANSKNIHEKNTYIKNYKKAEALKLAMKSENFFVYDQAMRDKQGMGEMRTGKDRTTKGGDPQGRGFCQKCKRESLWCKERHGCEMAKEV